jgi:hypothetical protein
VKPLLVFTAKNPVAWDEVKVTVPTDTGAAVATPALLAEIPTLTAAAVG